MPKLESLNIEGSLPNIEDFILNNIRRNFILNEISICNRNILKFVPFLQNQEKSVKKLKIDGEVTSSNMLELLSNLPNLKLNQLELSTWNNPIETNDERFLNFIRQSMNVDSFKLHKMCDAAINTICGTQQKLERLEISHTGSVRSITSDSTINFGKLKKLRNLNINICYANLNVLKGLALNINKNLEKLPNFIPNLKTLEICENFEHNLDTLKRLKNLERVDIYVDWRIYSYHSGPTLNKTISRRCRSKIKVLSLLNPGWPLTPKNARKIVTDFPKLESLQILDPTAATDESLEIILKGLKHLKTLNISQDMDLPIQ